jgi:hypothetical protein
MHILSNSNNDAAMYPTITKPSALFISRTPPMPKSIHAKATLKTTIQPSDVIFQAHVGHPGTWRFYNTIDACVPEYDLSVNKHDFASSLFLVLNQESRFFSSYTKGKGYHPLSPEDALKKIRAALDRANNKMHRKISTSLIDPGTLPKDQNVKNALHSFALPKFAAHSPKAEKLAWDILRHLLFYPSHAPSIATPGLVLTCDRPRGNPSMISSQRRVYQRNTFADPIAVPTHSHNTHMVHAYGTGSGRSTIGTPPRQVFMFTDHSFDTLRS